MFRLLNWRDMQFIALLVRICPPLLDEVAAGYVNGNVLRMYCNKRYGLVKLA